MEQRDKLASSNVFSRRVAMSDWRKARLFGLGSYGAVGMGCHGVKQDGTGKKFGSKSSGLLRVCQTKDLHFDTFICC